MDISATIETFVGEGLITRTLRPLRQGKEASVHLCQTDRGSTGFDLAALKIYHPLERRDFRDEAVYRQGEFIKDRRTRLALEQKTSFGRKVQAGTWINREWETLKALDASPVPSPVPIARHGSGILMSYVGDARSAAPRLNDIRPDDRHVAEDLWRQIEAAVEAMLFRDLVHADLSPYNILVWKGRVTVIDFPQTVDARKNHQAEAFLSRDVERVGTWFERFGLRRPWHRTAEDLWTAWTHADLIPRDLLP